MLASQKIQTALKMGDVELQAFADDIANQVAAIKPTEDRLRKIGEIRDLTHAIFDGEMDVRNAFNAPMSSEELEGLITDWFVQLGHLPPGTKHPGDERLASAAAPPSSDSTDLSR